MKKTSWQIDNTHSSIAFSVRHMVFAKVKGRFSDWSGAIELAGDDLSKASVSVEIRAASIDTGVADRDTHLRSPDFFDVERYPTLGFVSKRVVQSGSELEVVGDLSLHGVTREVSLRAEYNGRAKDPWGNERVAFSASTSIDRKDFGLTWNQVLEAGGVLVGDKIEISLDVQAVASSATKAA